MGPAALAQVLRPLQGMFPADRFPELLVGLAAGDDAAVYRVGADRALIQTVDFFPPIVDDPYDYGAIAAANAMSDVYAMGGEVALALNICCFPEELPAELLQDILRGGAEKVAEAGGVLAGGHTVTDPVLKYGLAVTGFVHPERVWTKAGARPGDFLVLTKPLGTGLTTTALKRKQLTSEAIADSIAGMKRLNRRAAALLRSAGVRACTDVTGFSLLGHGLEMAEASGVRFRLALRAIPLLDRTSEAVRLDAFPGGSYRNREHYQSRVSFVPGIDELERLLLFSPETSGGLLAAVPAERVEALRERSAREGEPLWVIGRVAEGSGIEVTSEEHL
jgi:selenide,water dikinase